MKRVLFFAPAALYYILIFYLSSRSHIVKVDIPFFDKGIHLVEFSIMGFLLAFGYFMSFVTSSGVKIILTLVSGFLLAILDELHQYFVPLRSFEIADLIVDVFGIFLGFFVYISLSLTERGKIFTKKLLKF